MDNQRRRNKVTSSTGTPKIKSSKKMNARGDSSPELYDVTGSWSETAAVPLTEEQISFLTENTDPFVQTNYLRGLREKRPTKRRSSSDSTDEESPKKKFKNDDILSKVNNNIQTLIGEISQLKNEVYKNSKQGIIMKKIESVETKLDQIISREALKEVNQNVSLSKNKHLHKENEEVSDRKCQISPENDNSSKTSLKTVPVFAENGNMPKISMKSRLARNIRILGSSSGESDSEKMSGVEAFDTESDSASANSPAPSKSKQIQQNLRKSILTKRSMVPILKKMDLKKKKSVENVKETNKAEKINIISNIVIPQPNDLDKNKAKKSIGKQKSSLESGNNKPVKRKSDFHDKNASEKESKGVKTVLDNISELPRSSPRIKNKKVEIEAGTSENISGKYMKSPNIRRKSKTPRKIVMQEEGPRRTDRCTKKPTLFKPENFVKPKAKKPPNAAKTKGKKNANKNVQKSENATPSTNNIQDSSAITKSRRTLYSPNSFRQSKDYEIICKSLESDVEKENTRKS